MTRLGDLPLLTLSTHIPGRFIKNARFSGCANKAEPFLLEALTGRRQKLGDTHPHTIESMNILINLYKVWNKPEEAEK